jgi:hypothetical protein
MADNPMTTANTMINSLKTKPFVGFIAIPF